jgi:hypothetical protein
MRLTFFGSLATAILFSGCAAMFHGKPELEIVGPPNLEVEAIHGGKLPVHWDYAGGLSVFPDPSKTDSIRISYGNKSTTVMLAKNPSGWELLDLLSYGFAYPIDDLSHSWFSYAPVYVTIDSSARGIDNISASTSNWLGEEPGTKRPRLLLLGGIALSFEENGDGAPVPFGSGSFPPPVLGLQAGIGVDLYKQFELFYLFRGDFTYPTSSNGYDGPSTQINSSDLCLRYFFAKNFFAQGSFGKAFVDNYYYSNVGYLPNGPAVYTSSPSFYEAGAALGWAGDISYIALQYFGGLKSVSLYNYSDVSNFRYHTVYLNFGLNFRL